MQRNFRNFILIGSLAALTATGAALAQSGSASATGSANGSGSSTSGMMPPDPAAPVNNLKDKAKNKSQQSGSSTPAGTTTGPNGGPSAGPISVTPPSQDNPNTAVDVTTDPAKAHAGAGTNGVNANAQLTPPNNPPAASKKLKNKKSTGSANGDTSSNASGQ